MDETIRQEGYLVFQESSGTGGWSKFHESKEKAEEVAVGMLSSSIPVIVIPAVRFTTRRIQERR